MAKREELSNLNIPNHVAIILDGNGRWAKKRFMPRNYGHMQGAKVVEQICEDADSIGIKYLTVYAFSTENWNRPQDEVEALMKLLRNYLKDCIKRANNNNMRVRVIGEKSRLSDDIRSKIEELEECSKNNTGLTINVALNYGGRDEILNAIKRLSVDEIKNLTVESFNKKLYTADSPDPDLIIRTAGEQRLSNFLLWQCAYSEFWYTDVLWPDFSRKILENAISDFSKRNRKFGGK